MAISTWSAVVLAVALVGCAASQGILFGSFTPSSNGQGESVWQAMNSWFQETNSSNPSNLMQSIRVVEVGWDKLDTLQSYIDQILGVWTFSSAVPVITWMPYGYKTWLSPTPNDDIVRGAYDDYIDAFLGNLSGQFTYQPQGYARQAYLRFAPAPNGNWFPWSPTCPPCGNNGQKIHQPIASYKQMWDYVIAKVRDPKYRLTPDVLQIMFDGATVDESGKLMDFVPNMTAPTSPNWFSLTGFNWGNTLPSNQWVSVKSLFGPALAVLKSASSSTPVAIVSAATVSHPNGVDAKEQWIQDLCDFTIKNLRMLSYHNADSGGDSDTAAFGGMTGYRNFSSPYSSANYTEYPAWRVCVQQPIFVGSNYSSNTVWINQTTFKGM